MRSITWPGIAGVLASLLAGCSTPPAPTGPTLARVTAETQEAYDHLWNSAGEALRKSYFRIDREDRIEGILTTYPETSAQFFEFWRPQPTPAGYWAESNLHTVPLEAQVTIRPTREEGGYELGVEVQRLRYTLEERQIDNAAAALRLFSADAPTVSGRMERPSETAQLTPIGRDQPAEERLLQMILRRYAKPPAPPEPEITSTGSS